MEDELKFFKYFHSFLNIVILDKKKWEKDREWVWVSERDSERQRVRTERLIQKEAEWVTGWLMQRDTDWERERQREREWQRETDRERERDTMRGRERQTEGETWGKNAFTRTQWSWHRLRRCSFSFLFGCEQWDN